MPDRGIIHSGGFHGIGTKIDSSNKQDSKSIPVPCKVGHLTGTQDEIS
jgi:hypothetical protein